MKNHGKFSCDRNARLFEAGHFRQFHAPDLQRRRSQVARQQGCCRLIEVLSDHLVTLLRDASISAGFTGFYRLGVSPRYAPALDDLLKRDASSNADTTDSAVMIPTPGAVINSWAVGFALAIAASRVSRALI